MPLSKEAPRQPIHHRVIDMQAYAREDGLYDVEARLVDRKPFPFRRRGTTTPLPPNAPVHDLWVRVTIDEQFTIHAVETASDVTPYGTCPEGGKALQSMVGERMAAGWSRTVKTRLRGAASCTHLMELLIPMATTAYQGVQTHLRMAKGVESQGASARVDSCWAYRRDGEVVRMLWPEYAARIAQAGEAQPGPAAD